MNELGLSAIDTVCEGIKRTTISIRLPKSINDAMTFRIVKPKIIKNKNLIFFSFKKAMRSDKKKRIKEG